MKKFYYILSDNPKYPQIMMAKSKAEVKKLLLEDLGPDREDSILNIFSEEEMNKTENGSVGYEDPDNFSSGNDFLNTVIQNANNDLKNKESTKVIIEQVDNQSNFAQESSQNNYTQVIKYFDAGGEHFKMENGKIYKKVWKPVENTDSYRIVNANTLKPITSTKYLIENLVWEEIE